MYSQVLHGRRMNHEWQRGWVSFYSHAFSIQNSRINGSDLPVPASAEVTADRFSVNPVEDPTQCGEPLNP